MKNQSMLLIISVLILSSCAMHNGLTSNLNNHTTHVELSQANYTVTAQVQGHATATYIVGIGGLNRQALVAEARADMLKEAALVGGSRAVINETIEVKNTLYPFVKKRTITVSAYVIQFKD